MPSYELALTIKTLAKPELVSTLKRTAEIIIQQGGILRQFTSLGSNQLPYRMRAHNVWHKEGTQFIMKFDAPTNSIVNLNDAFKRDIDIIRQSFVKFDKVSHFDCTLGEEMQAPAYRKDVEELIKEGRKEKKPFYQQRTPGYDYYPFQK